MKRDLPFEELSGYGAIKAVVTGLDGVQRTITIRLASIIEDPASVENRFDCQLSVKVFPAVEKVVTEAKA